MSTSPAGLLQTLALRERYRDAYWARRDPIAEDRLRWRAQTFRHTVHCLPGQRILELGGGSGLFTRQLARATRGENPITSVTFQDAAAAPPVAGVECLRAADLPGPRSEERRVGKECRSRWWAYHEKRERRGRGGTHSERD